MSTKTEKNHDDLPTASVDKPSTFIRTAYDGHRVRPVLVFDDKLEPSRTKQSFADECDINNILKRYEKTGIIEHVRQNQGQYGDFTNVVDYQTAVNSVIASHEAFASLPAHIRKRFDNDPGQFMDFVHDPKNESEMITLGLKNPPPATQDDAQAPVAPVQGETRSAPTTQA